ncbi:MAG: DUF4340 domain-containing protein [Bacteroidota bacterium]|jgi:hypothetical protein
MKKNKITLIGITTLAVLAILLLIVNSRKSTLNKAETQFAINDTANVTKVFIANKQGDKVKLVKQEDGTWKLNDQYEATIENVRLMLFTAKNLQVWAPVQKAAHNNMVKRMATASNKVEIYQKVFFIDFWGMKFFPYEKCTKTYYIGDPTMDNSGNFMMMEGAKKIYIVNIPGFRGFISPRFSCLESDWRDHSVFRTKISQIKEVKYEMPKYPSESFKIQAVANRKFNLIRLSDNSIAPKYDTTKVIEQLMLFRSLKYEGTVSGMSPSKKDSIIRDNLFQITTLTDNSGKITKVKMYTLPEYLIKNQDKMDELELSYSKDKFYIIINDSKDMYVAQYFVFERILQPLSYYLVR